MWKSELKNLTKNKMLLISLVAVACIPMLYATLFLGSIWDPYSKTHNLEVAVVNHDKSVTSGDTTFAVGDTLVDNLKGNNAFDWRFVSAASAKKGLEDGTYYMVLTIPEDFSKNASTVLDDAPRKMRLSYETNPGRNLISDVIMTKGIQTLDTELREEVTLEYVKSIFEQVTALGDGVGEAARGSAQLYEGIQQAASGNTQITANLDRFTQGTLEFTDGAQTLNVGIAKYVAGERELSGGIKRIADGTRELDEQSAALPKGASDLKDGAQTLKEGIASYTGGVGGLATGAAELDSKSGQLVQGADSLSQGATSLTQQTRDLPQKAEELDAGARQLKGGASTAQTSAAKLASGAAAVDSGLTQLSSALPSNAQAQAVIAKLDPATFAALPSAQQTEVLAQAQTLLTAIPATKATIDDQLLPASGQLSAGSATLASALSTLEGGASQLADATTELSQSVPLLTSGIAQLSSGAAQMDDGIKAYTDGNASLDEGIATLASHSSELNEGAAQLSDGTARLSRQAPQLATAISQLDAGSAKLLAGATTLSGNNEKLQGGADDLARGAQTLHDGSTQLAAGSSQLGRGLSQLDDGASELSSKLADGATQAQSVHPTQANYSMIAAPTQLDRSEYRSVANYGNGLAPYFLSLVLYVGAIAFSFIYPIKKPSSDVTSPAAWWASKALIVAVQGIVQALLVDFFMIVVLGLSVASIPKFMLVTCLVSLTYMMIVTVLSVAWGNVGRFVATVFMVLQMASTGGMFPINLSAGFFRFLNPLLPMTYSAYGYREALTGAMGTHTFLVALGVLGGYLLIATSALYLVFRASWKRGEATEVDFVAGSNRIDTNEGVVGAH